MPTFMAIYKNPPGFRKISLIKVAYTSFTLKHKPQI